MLLSIFRIQTKNPTEKHNQKELSFTFQFVQTNLDFINVKFSVYLLFSPFSRGRVIDGVLQQQRQCDVTGMVAHAAKERSCSSRDVFGRVPHCTAVRTFSPLRKGSAIDFNISFSFSPLLFLLPLKGVFLARVGLFIAGTG